MEGILNLENWRKFGNDEANEKYFHNYINCATENGIIGYPIQYCPICGKNLNKS